MAKEHPRYENMEFPEYEHQEYPKMVYPGASDPKKPYVTEGKAKGKMLPGVLVNNAREEAEAMGGEVEEEAPPPAPRGKAKTVSTAATGTSRLRTDADDHADLVAEAGELGVQIDKSWSIARIQDAIDTHKAAAAAAEEPVV